MRHGSHLDPDNRFEKIRREQRLDDVQWDDEYLRLSTNRPIEYFEDATKTIVAENKSPDLPFRFSLNPYRGCIHGCSYCYARPTHEYLGFNAGMDFETKIVVKREAPKLFREFLSRKSWKPESIAFSGVTDCYQPAEREFRLTRQCLEVAFQCRQPISIVTKNALVTRDLDLLSEMARERLVHVFVSITTLDAQLAREMEPRTSIPTARLRAIEMLAAANVPVGVMTAPIIPGLNDSELPEILRRASEAGASAAGYVLLRLPLSVQAVFEEWVRRTQAIKAERILSRIQSTRGGAMNQSAFGERMAGTGPIAQQIRNLFDVFRRKHGLEKKLPDRDFSRFLPPADSNGQGMLF